MAAAVALVTPALLASPRVMYAGLAVAVAVAVAAGMLIGWARFHRPRRNQFDVEADDIAEVGAPSPERRAQPLGDPAR